MSLQVAIHDSPLGFHSRWAVYCAERGIRVKRVDCTAHDAVKRLSDCDAVMWHHTQVGERDLVMARQLLASLEHAGTVVFPDGPTGWHFDDKVAQAYLFDALGFAVPDTRVFTDREAALEWLATAPFPQVFKLRGGAGSANVTLVRDRAQAERLVRAMFGRGIPSFDPWWVLRDRWRQYRAGLTSSVELLRGVARLLVVPKYAKTRGRERGYALFQSYVPGNDHDLRIIVIGDRAFGIKRFVRDGDFRASGSGYLSHARTDLPEDVVRLAFTYARRLRAQCVAFDFVRAPQGTPLLLEISYAFTVTAYDACPGYWTSDLTWHEGSIRPQDWMVDAVLAEVHRRWVEGTP